jgi:hypothetical protein
MDTQAISSQEPIAMTFFSQDSLLTLLALVMVVVLILATNEIYLWQFRRRNDFPPRPRGTAANNLPTQGDPD